MRNFYDVILSSISIYDDQNTLIKTTHQKKFIRELHEL
jgi:hypothetical protein